MALVLNLLTSNDWCFSSLAAVLVAVFAAFTAHYLLGKAGVSEATRQRLLLILVFVIGVGCGSAFRMSKARAFYLAFNSDKLAGVSNIKVTRHFSGGPCDHVLFLQFNSSESALHELLSNQNFVIDSEFPLVWSAGQAQGFRQDFWQSVFGGLLPPDHTWRQIPVPIEFEVYRGGKGIAPKITILWDTGSQLAYVLYSFG